MLLNKKMPAYQDTYLNYIFIYIHDINLKTPTSGACSNDGLVPCGGGSYSQGPTLGVVKDEIPTFAISDGQMHVTRMAEGDFTEPGSNEDNFSPR